MTAMLDHPRTCERIHVCLPGKLANEVEQLAIKRHRQPLCGKSYLVHAAGVGHFQACLAAAARWTFFQDDERDRALVQANLGIRTGCTYPEKLR